MSRRPPPSLVSSPRAALRVAACVDFLASRPRGEPLLVVGASREAADEVVRAATARTGGGFGWYRTTLFRLAAELALPALAARGLAPASFLAVEAVCARVVAELASQGKLGRYAPVANLPGLPRAFARTLAEVRLAEVPVASLPPELSVACQAFDRALERAGLADRAVVLRHAIEQARSSSSAMLDLPTVWVDVPLDSPLAARFAQAVTRRAPASLATAPWPTEPAVIEAFGPPQELPVQGDDALARLQQHLFARSTPSPGELGDSVVLLSAPGESRECVEIARRLHAEAARGVPFDRMAVLLHAGAAYRGPLAEALGRADIPYWAAQGTHAPDPAGRAMLSLLACAAEGLSARRFAEYLSLGELPAATESGAPPPAAPAGDRFVAPDEDLVPILGLQPEEDPAPLPGSPEGPVIDGVLRAPRRWERLMVDAAVIGGLERWRRRLDGLGAQINLERIDLEQDDPRHTHLDRRLAQLRHLRAYALPLLHELHGLPAQATWGEWLEALGALATRALRRPERVLAVLSELRPMAELGPVTLQEVRLVLGPRLGELSVRPASRRYGQVFVGSIEAARGLDFDVVFVPGLAERVFPHKVVEDPILLDTARASLPGLKTNQHRSEAERSALRLAVGAASARVVLSWPRVDAEQGRPRVPSFYGLEVLRAAEGVLPGFDELSRRAEEIGDSHLGWPAPHDPMAAIDAAERDLSLLGAVLHRGQGDAAGTAHYLLSTNPHLARALRARARRWQVRKFTNADGLVDPRPEGKQALQAHALSARSFSPTALQGFASCPYRFLLRTVHRLEPREEPVQIEYMDPLSRGSLVHQVQFELLTALRDAGQLPVTPSSFEQAKDVLDSTLDRVAERYRDDLAPAIDRVWTDAINGLRGDLREWLRRLSLETEWLPWRFELSYGLRHSDERDEHSQDEPVTLDNGLILRGSIDLVERNAAGELRATDYKTGKARLKKGAYIAGGEALQPVLYALALEKLFEGSKVTGGRLYYCTAKGEFEERIVPLDADARGVSNQLVRVIDQWITQARLPAAPAPGACQWCDYQTVCGPSEELRVERVKDRLATADLDYLRSLK